MKIGGMFRNSTDHTAYDRGSVIFNEGELGAVMYVVIEGEVEIRLGDKVLETIGPEEVFGEMGLIDGQRRSATAVARTDCRLVCVDQKRFTFMVQQTPFFALQLMKVLADRLRRLNTLIPR